MTTKQFYYENMKHIEAQLQRTDKDEDWKFRRGFTVKAYEDYKRLYETEQEGIEL